LKSGKQNALPTFQQPLLLENRYFKKERKDRFVAFGV
jgi:hypothetical protein